MRIEIKGRNLTVGDELSERVEKKFAKIGRQVSPLAEMEIELKEERNPSIRESCVAEATLHLKGTTLRARERSDDMVHCVVRAVPGCAGWSPRRLPSPGSKCGRRSPTRDLPARWSERSSSAGRWASPITWRAPHHPRPAPAPSVGHLSADRAARQVAAARDGAELPSGGHEQVVVHVDGGARGNP